MRVCLVKEVILFFKDVTFLKPHHLDVRKMALLFDQVDKYKRPLKTACRRFHVQSGALCK